MGSVEFVVTHLGCAPARLKGAGTDGAVGRQENIRQVAGSIEGPAADVCEGIKTGDFAQLRRFVEGPTWNHGGARGPVDVVQATVCKCMVFDARHVGHACDRGDFRAPSKSSRRDSRHARRHKEGSVCFAWAVQRFVRYTVTCLAG